MRSLPTLLFTSAQIAAAGFFGGPLGASLLIASNRRALGQPPLLTAVLGLMLGVGLLLVTLTLPPAMLLVAHGLVAAGAWRRAETLRARAYGVPLLELTDAAPGPLWGVVLAVTCALLTMVVVLAIIGGLFNATRPA